MHLKVSELFIVFISQTLRHREISFSVDDRCVNCGAVRASMFTQLLFVYMHALLTLMEPTTHSRWCRLHLQRNRSILISWRDESLSRGGKHRFQINGVFGLCKSCEQFTSALNWAYWKDLNGKVEYKNMRSLYSERLFGHLLNKDLALALPYIEPPFGMTKATLWWWVWCGGGGVEW